MGGVSSGRGHLLEGVLSQAGHSHRLAPLLREYLWGLASCAVARACATLQPREAGLTSSRSGHATPLAGGSTYLVLGPVPVCFPLQVDTPSYRVGPEGSPGSLRITCHPEASVTPCPRTPCQIEVRCVCFCVFLKNKRKSTGQIFIELGAPLPLPPLPCHGCDPP